jgi:hypothetical protein
LNARTWHGPACFGAGPAGRSLDLGQTLPSGRRRQYVQGQPLAPRRGRDRAGPQAVRGDMAVSAQDKSTPTSSNTPATQPVRRALLQLFLQWVPLNGPQTLNVSVCLSVCLQKSQNAGMFATIRANTSARSSGVHALSQWSGCCAGRRPRQAEMRAQWPMSRRGPRRRAAACGAGGGWRARGPAAPPLTQFCTESPCDYFHGQL